MATYACIFIENTCFFFFKLTFWCAPMDNTLILSTVMANASSVLFRFLTLKVAWWRD